MRTAQFLLVGYVVETNVLASKLEPSFEAPSNYKDPVKIAESIAKQKVEYQFKAAGIPYIGQLKEVVVLNKHGKLKAFANTPKATIAKQLVAYLIEHFGDYLTTGGDFESEPVRLIGFEIKRFVKLLGIAAALEDLELPHAFWYGADHRDAEEIFLPNEVCKGLPMAPILGLLKATVHPDYTPCVSPALDLAVIAHVLRRFNLFPESNATLQTFADNLK